MFKNMHAAHYNQKKILQYLKIDKYFSGYKTLHLNFETMF